MNNLHFKKNTVLETIHKVIFFIKIKIYSFAFESIILIAFLFGLILGVAPL